MTTALIAAAALAVGYVIGRTQPLARARHWAWAKTFLGSSPSNLQALTFLALHPLVTAKTAAGSLAKRVTGTNPFARPAPEPVTVKLPERRAAEPARSEETR